MQDVQRAATLDAAATGRGISRGAAICLLDSSVPLLPLLAAASALRDHGKGRTITYSRKVFLPLTNLCRDRCGYCTSAAIPATQMAGS